MEKFGEYKTSYNLKVESINQKSKFKNTNIIIYVKNGEKIEYGDKIKFKGDYNKPSRATNYKGFDYANYLKTKYIYRYSNSKRITKNNRKIIFK